MPTSYLFRCPLSATSPRLPLKQGELVFEAVLLPAIGHDKRHTLISPKASSEMTWRSLNISSGFMLITIPTSFGVLKHDNALRSLPSSQQRLASSGIFLWICAKHM